MFTRTALLVYLLVTINHLVVSFVPTITLPAFRVPRLNGAQPITLKISAQPVLATPNEVHDALQEDDTIVLDVRGLDEIQNSGYLRTGKQWLNVPCTPLEAPLLSLAAEDMFPHKDKPILVYCASGKRAGRAKEELEKLGYTRVLNLGGFNDLVHLQNPQVDM